MFLQSTFKLLHMEYYELWSIYHIPEQLVVKLVITRNAVDCVGIVWKEACLLICASWPAFGTCKWIAYLLLFWTCMLPLFSFWFEVFFSAMWKTIVWLGWYLIQLETVQVFRSCTYIQSYLVNYFSLWFFPTFYNKCSFEDFLTSCIGRDLSCNHFTGPIPFNIGFLQVATLYVAFSCCNMLYGDICLPAK
jgi:hypothetical protein